MRELLRDAPVHATEVVARDRLRLRAGRRDLRLEMNVVRLWTAGFEIRERRGILRRTLDAKRLERIHRDDPRRNGRRERLAVERPERNVLPLLQVTGAPV